MLDDQQRLKAVRALSNIDIQPGDMLEDLVWLASVICDIPISLVTLVDADRQLFMARWGIDEGGTARSESFCQYTIEQEGVFEVADASRDLRFANFPLVKGDQGLRFYAGAPIRSNDNQKVGSLCVLDTKPRELTSLQRDALLRLARRAGKFMEARRQNILSSSRERAVKELLEILPDGLVSCDAEGRLREFNATARAWHGVDPRDYPQSDWAHHFGLFEEHGTKLLSPDQIPLIRAWSGERVINKTISIHAKGQAPRTVSCNAIPLKGSHDEILGAVCTMHDVTDRSRLATELSRKAHTDELTGLPNRAAWMIELETAMGRARQDRKPIVVGFLDLDRFKAVNDLHGHGAGDEVLRQVAVRIKQTLRSSDFVARLAGDEFVIRLDNAGNDPELLDKLATSIRSAISRPLIFEGITLEPRCSIGFSVCENLALTAHQIMQTADAAMYRAKRNREHPCVVVLDS